MDDLFNQFNVTKLIVKDIKQKGYHKVESTKGVFLYLIKTTLSEFSSIRKNTPCLCLFSSPIDLDKGEDIDYNYRMFEYYSIIDINTAVNSFLDRLSMLNGSRNNNLNMYSDYYRKLTEDPHWNTPLSIYIKEERTLSTLNSHYDYLKLVIDNFSKLVFGEKHHLMMNSGMVVAHGDKGGCYKGSWEEHNIPFHRGMLMYLLTYTKAMDEEKHKSCEWVIDNYPKYLPMIEEAERLTLKEKFDIII